MQPNKRWRIYITTPRNTFSVAASNTVNNLVTLAKYWLANTSAGQYLPDDITGVVALHELDENTGAYKRQESASFKNKKDIITQVRKLGAR